MFEVPATAIARTELLKLLPAELVDRILVIVYHYDFRFTMTQIDDRKFKKSIWYEPSATLLKLCLGKRGGIQTGLDWGSWELPPQVTQMKFIEPWFLFATYNKFRDWHFYWFGTNMGDLSDSAIEEEAQKRWERDNICINGCPLCEDRFPCLNNVFATYPGVPTHHDNISYDILAKWNGAYYGKGGGISVELNLNNY